MGEGEWSPARQNGGGGRGCIHRFMRRKTKWATSELSVSPTVAGERSTCGGTRKRHRKPHTLAYRRGMLDIGAFKGLTRSTYQYIRYRYSRNKRNRYASYSSTTRKGQEKPADSVSSLREVERETKRKLKPNRQRDAAPRPPPPALNIGSAARTKKTTYTKYTAVGRKIPEKT